MFLDILARIMIMLALGVDMRTKKIVCANFKFQEQKVPMH